METADPHPNERYRLDVLRLYKILDTVAERSFDDLTQLAADICETPISLVSLVDRKRQWFKSKVGVDVPETDRQIAFCSHVVHSSEFLIVPDTLEDNRFHDNPLVTDDPKIRFYAGAPLVVREGVPLGTLCVIDRKPRELTSNQRRALETLSRAVVTQLELRRMVDEVKTLSSLLPICAWCRKVREEDGSWRPLESYLFGENAITHGICPECLQRSREELDA